jgi:hypothetical protein
MRERILTEEGWEKRRKEDEEEDYSGDEEALDVEKR